MKFLISLSIILNLITLALVFALHKNQPEDRFIGYTASDLTLACRVGNVGKIEEFLELGFGVNEKDIDGWLPLSMASGAGKLEAVKLLISKGADINEQSSRGNTPLIFAITRNRPEVVKFLLENGADPKLSHVKGWDAFKWAEDMKDDQLIELLAPYKD